MNILKGTSKQQKEELIENKNLAIKNKNVENSNHFAGIFIHRNKNINKIIYLPNRLLLFLLIRFRSLFVIGVVLLFACVSV